MTRITSERVLRGRDAVGLVLLACVNLAAVAYFVSFWMDRQVWRDAPWIYGIVTVCLCVIVANYAGRWLMLVLMERPVPVELKSGRRVGVATTFVPGAEDLGMLEQSVLAMVSIDYPHETWVLDEGDEPRVADLCRRLGACHFSRKFMPQYQAVEGKFASRTKYGNINAWLEECGFARYDIVSLFDPDHVPSRSFLSRVLGYFEDPAIGYVQAAQAYSNQAASIIARGAAEETYAYNSSIQMAAYGMGYPIIVGSHNTHRVEAIRDIGGLAPHDADDLLTTLVYQSRGWRGVFVPEILARGLAPVDWPGYLEQQRRWARSVIEVKLRFQPRLAARLSPATRTMSMLQGLNYLYRSFVFGAAFVLLAFTMATAHGASVLEHVLSWQLAFVWAVMAATDLVRQRFYLDRANEQGLHWRVGVLQFAKWPYMMLALLDVLRRRRVPYSITPKSSFSSRRPRTFVPHLMTASVVGLAWLGGLLAGRSNPLVVHAAAAVVVLGLVGLALSYQLSVPAASKARVPDSRT